MTSRVPLRFAVLACLSAAAVSAGSNDIPEIDVTTDIPIVTVLGFQPRARGDLFPRPDPTIHVISA